MLNTIKKAFYRESTIFVLIWLVLLIFPFLGQEPKIMSSISLLFIATRANIIALSVVNNFLLLPQIIKKGRYGFYFASAIACILLFSFNEEFVIEQILASGTERAEWSMRGFYFALFRTTMIVLIFSSYKLLWDYQSKLTKIKSLEKEKVESELKFLKSQVNPHVLFNNLNNIYSLALEKSSQVPDMILKLSQMMRYMLYDCNERFVPLEKEIKYLKDFIELQKLRLEENAMVNFSIEGDPENKKIAPLLLITFIENSFKHSMDTTDKAVEIIIRMEITEKNLNFHTANTYSPDSEKKMDTKGIGLKNVKKRLELIYGNQYELNIYPENHYYHVTLELELMENESISEVEL